MQDPSAQQVELCSTILLTLEKFQAVDLAIHLSAVPGVGFTSFTEEIDTRSLSGHLRFHAFGTLAELERKLIRERTLAGLKAARARGRNGGRRRKVSANDLKIVTAMLKSEGIPVSTAAVKFDVTRSTLYRNVVSAA